MDFTEKEEGLVTESWEILKKDLALYSLHFFTQILEMAPEAKGMFSFLRDAEEIPYNNPKLKAHALKVFKMSCEAAIQLREKGEVLQYLGSVHLLNGVIDPHFQVVKEALLRTVKKGVGEKWSEANQISNEMKCHFIAICIYQLTSKFALFIMPQKRKIMMILAMASKLFIF